MNKYPKIVFIGTNNFAVNSLIKILKYSYSVVGVITIPDIIKKNKIIFSPIKKLAIQKKLYILQPKNLEDIYFIKKLKNLNADIQIVISFKILPKIIWNMPPLGTFNLHPSLLPKYKGPAPIQWAIINGEKQSGVTTFMIDNGIDTGRILLQKKIKINQYETYQDIYHKFSIIGAYLVIKTIEKYIIYKNNIPYIHSIKKNKNIKYAPKLNQENCKINWLYPLKKIFDKIRGLDDKHPAWTYIKINNKFYKFKIYKTFFKNYYHNYKYGTIIYNKNIFKICVNGGYLFIQEAQIEGKKKLNIKNMINGIYNQKFVLII